MTTLKVVNTSTFVDLRQRRVEGHFAAAGHVYPHLISNPVGAEKYYQRRLLFRNLANGKYADVSRSSGPGPLQERASRGVATGDLDNDGDIDFVVANLDDVPSVLRNDGGNGGNWLILELRGMRSNRFGLGARIRLKAGGLEQVAEVPQQVRFEREAVGLAAILLVGRDDDLRAGVAVVPGRPQ